ncbi:MAG TPA: aldo/keto reductase [Opitutus sp.]|nr:aldo/keto reductase [Opitutus sp.]
MSSTDPDPPQAAVPLRRCGNSPLQLPVLGLGCWAYGGGDYWGSQSQRDVDSVVHDALGQGCNFFDTAEAYNNGASESSLGAALRGVPRDDVILCTKISPSNVGRGTLEAHCDASLRRLQADYIDLYLVHWPVTAHSIRHFAPDGTPVPSVTEAFDGLQRLQQSGKIRHIGVSNFGPARLAEALATGARIVVDELPYNLLSRAIELEALPFCRRHGIGVLGYMALQQGVISDKYRQLDDLPAVRRRTRHFDSRKVPQARHGLPGAEAETAAALRAIRAIAARHGLPTSELALKWAFSGDGITSCLCGARNVPALREAIRAAREPLPAAVIAELNRVTRPLLEALGPGFDYYEHPSNDRTK